MDAAARALAEPRRREILALLRDGERAAGEIAVRFDVTRPAVSQHLAVLEATGLVTVRREGTRRLYSVRREGLAELKAFLESFWDDRLAKLKREAERKERRRHGRHG